MFLNADEHIIKQGERDMSAMYTIMNGNTKVVVQNYNDTNHRVEDFKVKTMKTGDYFGEIALLMDSYRTASVVSVNYCTLGELNLENLHSLTVNFPIFRSILFNQINLYDDSVHLFKISALKNIEYLKEARPETLQMLAYSMKY